MTNISEQTQTITRNPIIVDIMAANAPLHPVYPLPGLNNFDEFIQYYYRCRYHLDFPDRISRYGSFD